jgi:hypothetical protein
MIKFQKTKIILLSAIIFCGLFGLARSSQAATYYVSPDGGISSTCINSDPCSLTTGISQINSPGDRLILKNGTYTGTGSANYNDATIFLNAKHGNNDNPIVISSETPLGATLTHSTWGFLVQVTNSSYLIIEGFELTGGGVPLNINISNHIVFRKNKVHHVGNQAVYCGHCSMSGRNVTHECSSNPCNAGEGSCVETPGVWMGGGALGADLPSSYIVYDSNILYSNGRPTGYCIEADGKDHGIYAQEDYSWAINNVIYDIRSGYDIHYFDSDNYDWSEHIYILNNTIIGGVGMRQHVVNWYSQNDIHIENNISYLSPNDAAFYARGTNSGSDGMYPNYLRNNLVFGSGVDLQLSVDSLAWTKANNIVEKECLSLGTPWPCCTGVGDGCDPSFANPATRDYSLTLNSPAVNAGRDVSSLWPTFMDYSAPKDHAGNIKSGAWDIGAYEYQGGDTTAPSAPSGLSVQ